jgi:hypothetical protein
MESCRIVAILVGGTDPTETIAAAAGRVAHSWRATTRPRAPSPVPRGGCARRDSTYYRSATSGFELWGTSWGSQPGRPCTHYLQNEKSRSPRPARSSRPPPRDSDRLARQQAAHTHMRMSVCASWRSSAQKHGLTRVGSHLASKFGPIRAGLGQTRCGNRVDNACTGGSTP